MFLERKLSAELEAFFTLIYINTNRDLNYMRYTKMLVYCIHNCSEKVSSHSEESSLQLAEGKKQK